MPKQKIKYNLSRLVLYSFILIAAVSGVILFIVLETNTALSNKQLLLITASIFLLIGLSGFIVSTYFRKVMETALLGIESIKQKILGDEQHSSQLPAVEDELSLIHHSFNQVSDHYEEELQKYKNQQSASEQALQREEFAKFHLNQEIEFMSNVYSISNDYKKLTRKSDLFKRLGKDICDNFLFHVAILYEVVEGRLKISNAYFRGLNYLNDLFGNNCLGYSIPGSHEIYKVLRDQKPYTTHYPPCYEKMEEVQANGHFAMIPIRGNSRNWAVLAVGFLGPARFIEARDVDRMMLFSSAVGLILDIIETVENLEQGLHARNQELEKANTLLQRSIHEKEEFLRGISHDLNAPLRNVAGLIDSIHRKFTDSITPELNDRLERVRRNVDKELELIDELLELSRSKTRKIVFEDIDINAIIEETLDHLNYEISEKRIEVSVQQGMPVLNGDKHIISQIFQNLIDNAVKYIPTNAEKRKIEIACLENGNFYEFSVKDSGIGISESEFDKIFSIFYKAGNSINSGGSGKGVGLAMIKSLIERLNGNIWVNSRPGIGSTFYFTLPKPKKIPIVAVPEEKRHG